MTRQDILEMIDAYNKAEIAALKGKSYSINGRSLTRNDLSEIREGRQEWEQRLASYDMRQRGGSNLTSVADWR